LDTGACNSESAVHSGLCAETPDVCSKEWDPVCGCDQKTYSNVCFAHFAGFSVSRIGKCDSKPTLPTGSLEDTSTPSCPESLDGIARPNAGTVLYYALVPSNPPGANNGLLCARLETKGEGWVSFGISEDGWMVGSDAIIGMPGDNTVLKYDLAGQNVAQVVAMDDDKQTLMDTSIVQSGGITIMEFTKMLVEDGEIAILEEGVNDFLYAKGGDNLGYHSTRTAFTKDFSEDVVPPSTTSPTLTAITATKESCQSGATCSESGSTCGRGTETCCGVTHDSLKCTCADRGNGRLEYSICLYTEACMMPSCCGSGSPADQPPAAPGTCNRGSLCDTGIEDDYCCTDMKGAGTYCSKSGGSIIPAIEMPGKCEVGPNADPATACGMGEFCELDTGACNSESAVHSGLCAETPEMCTEEWDPVCGCDGRTHSNVCKARSAGTSISGMGACASDVPTNQPTNVPTNLPTVQPTTLATLATAESVKAEPTTGPISSTLPPTSNPTGPPSKEATEMPSKSPIGASTSTSSLTGSPSKETPASVATTVTSTTAATSSEGTATSAATTDASTTGTTTVSTAATTASFAIDGDFPTKAPSTKLSNSEVPTPPPNWWEEQEDLDRATSPNSAFNHSRSFLFYVATTFMAIVFVSVILPGNGGNNNLWGFGKFAVAAMAVSSLYSKRFPASKGGSIRKNNHKGSESFPAPNQRALQKICTYNVEILIDGCAHPLEISAPSGRVVDVVIEDLESEQRPDDSCVTDYQATLNFTVTDEKDVLDLKANGTVDTLPQWGFQCLQAVAGRPFVDATGGSLQAIPWVPDDEAESMISALSWTGEALMETHASSISNATSRGRFLLGEDWIQRALGEHASVASFSAFSIALMSNQAPSDLVEDALKAGLDEVRHSRISFDIASKLTGKEVGPGPLPESKLEFGQDLKALALAVAREGCVDETLSTFAAAVEVKHITDVLNEGVQDTPYSSIDRDLLAFIRNALVTIAMDESNHSALAWRTLNWVCSVDRNVCDAVYMDVFEESNLEMRFKQRAASLFGETSSVLHSMRGEWKKIFKAHQGKPVPESICNDDDMVHVGEDQSGQPLLTSVTESVLRQVSCI